MKNRTTVADLLRDGWKKTTVNGVRCLKLILDDDSYLIGSRRDPWLSPHDFYDLTAKLGKPYRVHTLPINDGNGNTVYGIASLEFVVSAPECN